MTHVTTKKNEVALTDDLTWGNAARIAAGLSCSPFWYDLFIA
jgi:hypothetical protein